jgi:hypothetical protein
MAATIRPLRSRRRTAQRGKPMSQSQRWGKVVTTMAVPEGVITTSEIFVEDTEPATAADEAIAEAILAEEVEDVEI